MGFLSIGGSDRFKNHWYWSFQTKVVSLIQIHAVGHSGIYNSAAGFVSAKDVFLLGVGKKHPLDFREAPPPKHECPPLPTKQPACSNCRHTDTHTLARPPLRSDLDQTTRSQTAPPRDGRTCSSCQKEKPLYFLLNLQCLPLFCSLYFESEKK